MRHNFCRFEVGGQRSGGAVHQHLSNVIQQFLGSILRRSELEELWVLIDEVRVDRAVQELLVLQHVQQKWNVCLQNKLISILHNA